MSTKTELPLPLPLKGVRVLELGHFLSAPRATRLLAEAGAEVIKVEPPTGDPLRLLLTVTGVEKALSIVNAGKRGMVINLKSNAGQKVLFDLVKKSDVLVENYVPGALARMGITESSLWAANPKLVYASVSGFGHGDAGQGVGAFDVIGQATSGIMDGLHMNDRPPPIFFADLVSGAYCALGVVQALYAAEKSGKGRRVDISMQDVMYTHHFSAHVTRAIGDAKAQASELLGRSFDELLTDAENPMPFWNSYAAKDGHVAVVALSEGQWRGLMMAIDNPDLATDTRFSDFLSRVHNAEAGTQVVAQWMARHTTEEIVTALRRQKVPCGPVLDRQSANADPHLRDRGLLSQVEHARLGAIPIPGSAIFPWAQGDPPSRPHPELGEHTDEILNGLLKLDAAHIETLRREGAVG
jgi:crotonobetainyl-CoA:carnitine CoA-transferase CaiB-like acyl-CoA transferase